MACLRSWAPARISHIRTAPGVTLRRPPPPSDAGRRDPPARPARGPGRAVRVPVPPAWLAVAVLSVTSL